MLDTTPPGPLTHVYKGKGQEVSINPGSPNDSDPPDDHHSSDNNRGHSRSLTPRRSGPNPPNPPNDPDDGPPGHDSDHNTEDSDPDCDLTTKAVRKEVMGIFRGISSENSIKTRDPDTFNGSDPDKLSAFFTSCASTFWSKPQTYQKGQVQYHREN